MMVSDNNCFPDEFTVRCRCGGRAIVHQDTRELGLEKGGWSVDCGRGIACPHRSSASVWWKLSREAAIREWNAMQRSPKPLRLQCRMGCGGDIQEWHDGIDGAWNVSCRCGRVTSRRSDVHAREMYTAALGIDSSYHEMPRELRRENDPERSGLKEAK